MSDDVSAPDNTAQVAKNDDKFLVVGLGASAGGIQALKEFFNHVTKDSGMAYVVILHMSPEHESRLAEILQVTSPIPVTQVRERVKVKPNHVYVIPPNQNLAMSDGHLALTNMIGVEERRSPVDLFFRTLAETNDSRAVSVILSGTGANGSMGLKRVKENGGSVFVQEPAEAEYADMPRNAIATGLVDYVLPVSEIPRKIASFSNHLTDIQMAESALEIVTTDEQALREIFAQLRSRTGHDFSNYKRATMLRRMERRLRLRELPGIPAYALYLKEHPNEAQALMKDLLISVTNFFRDEQSFKALGDKILPEIFRHKNEDDNVRVWVAGCATGEEAYTLAMLLSETLGNSPNAPQIQLFATDLDADAIAIAREGYYTEAEVADVSPERIRRYFNREPEGYRVKRELRETILFAVHNVIKDPPFSHLDLISCRNLLIYLNRTAQTRVLEVMHFALNPGGFLFLGGSESTEGAIDLFSTKDKDHHIYQSRPVHPRTTIPVPELGLRTSLPVRLEKESDSREERTIERLSYADLHQHLLEQMAPPSLVVNEEYDIVHVSARAGQYLQFSGGEPSHNLLRVVRPELRLELRTSLYQAVQSKANIEARGLKVKTDEGFETVDIIVRPVLRDGDPTRGFILVIFEKSEKTAPDEPKDIVRVAEPVARHLEEELLHSKSQLRATVEQYEIQQEELRASNEELQAMNEELRSAAEELETSKEELQSVNEELTTVNQELKIKIEELSHANNDFTNLINSTDIGTIFLDRALRVKLFTPRAREAFNLIASDVGRPLSDITNKLAYDNLVADVEYVLKTLQTATREVQSGEGNWYMMRILPYRTTEDHIDGIVVTFMDITDNKMAKQELEDSRTELEIRVAERTGELSEANQSLWTEVSERRKSELARMRLVNQLVTAQEFERRRIARELHDQLGQQLTSLRLKLESLNQDPDRGGLREKVDDLLSVTSQLDSDIEFLAWELRPVALDDLGLSAALQNYISRWSQQFKVAAQFHTAGFDGARPSREIETNLYRIAQEALNNVAKHSRASNVDVILERRDHHAVLIIEDNGVGFEPVEDQGTDGENMGLTGMRERAMLIGGSLDIESTLQKGTSVFVRVPLNVEGGGD
jgi:two-component system, chemotaxis family, CheB/CheR fusion protein